MQKERQIGILAVLAIIMFVNAALSGYIYYQKQALLSGKTVSEACFSGTVGAGGCADVQFSEYGTILGISVGLLGIILFAFMAILLGSFAYSLKYGGPISSDADLNFTRKFLLFAFIIAIIGAVYFIYLQLFVLNTICKYCMVIDMLTILSSVVYIANFKRGISFFLA